MPRVRRFFLPKLGRPSVALQHTLVYLALAVTWLAGLGLAATGRITDSPDLSRQAVPILVLAVLITVQVAVGYREPLFTLAVAFVVNAIGHRVSPAPETIGVAAFAAVAVAGLGAALLTNHIRTYLVAGTIGLFALGQWWAGGDEGTMWGMSMSMVFLVLAATIVLVSASVHSRAEEYQRLFEEAPIALLEQNWTETIAYVNSLGRPVAELTRAELEEAFARIALVRVNRAFMDLMFPEGGPLPDRIGIDRARTLPTELMAAEVAAVVGNHTGLDQTYLTTPYQGGPEMWLTVRSITRRSDEHGVSLLLSMENVTDRVKRESALQDLVEQKDRFIASVSHELRTPLTAVVGLAEILAEDETDPDRVEMFDLLVGQSRELSYLIEDLLVGARAEAGTVSIRSELIDLVPEVVRVVGGLADAVLMVEIPPRLPVVADPLRTRQIIRNLLVNARRYGGVRRRLIAYPESGRVVMEVRDSGSPLPGEDIERIFAPYGRARARPGEVGSLGLGLHVARQLAELMGGTLSYIHDGETVFRLVLPGPDTVGMVIDRVDARVP